MNTIDVTQEHRIAATPDVVWEILTTRIGEWWQAPYRLFEQDSEIRLDLIIGGLLSEHTSDGGAAAWGAVSRLEPRKHLEFTGPCGMSGAIASTFSFALSGAGKETVLTLRHQAVGTVTGQQQEGYNKGWTFLVGNLKSLAAAL